MTWRRDERPENVRTFGDFTVFSEVDSERQTAHVVRFPYGREVRVLPDDRSGAQRARILKHVVETTADLSERVVSPDGVLIIFRGACDEFSLMWEEVTPEQSIEEWLDAWFIDSGFIREATDLSSMLLQDLDANGWEVRRRDDR